jgi:tetratricopeptide (TPR) repeat protein
MTQIHAFVGHSFTENDKSLVDKFLQYLNQLSEVLPAFTWKHAEHAEPSIVSEKVLRLLEGKNLFVGICTKKEMVISSEKLGKLFFSESKWQGLKQDFSWKTSDWIIQEIGLAIGLKLNVILLLEQGVKAPGALQGNLEYITFDRDAPERCFGKILEMISALSPKTDLVTTAKPASKATASELKDVDPPHTQDDFAIVKPDWIRRDFEFAYWKTVFSDMKEQAKVISDAYLASALSLTDQDKTSWAAFEEYTHLLFERGGDFVRLKTLAEANPTNRDVSNYLGQIYDQYGDHEKAAFAFTTAAKSPKDADDELLLLGKAAAAYQKAKLPDAAVALLGSMRSKPTGNGRGEKVILNTLVEVSKISKDDFVLTSAMERVLELDPADKETRFSLAYKYSDMGEDELATFHYFRIPMNERSEIAWNNLGVSLDRLGLHGKAIAAYRKSEEGGETLAMSNLANKLIEAGFLIEAQKICNIALSKENYHKNITATLGRLKELPDEEEKSELEVFSKASLKSDFYRQLGAALSRTFPLNPPTIWQGKRGALSLVVDGPNFTLTGTYEVRAAGLLGLTLRGLNSTASDSVAKPVRWAIQYSGVMRGNAMLGKVSRKRVNDAPTVPSLLGSIDDSKQVLMFLDAEQKKLDVLEMEGRSAPSFYCLTAT